MYSIRERQIKPDPQCGLYYSILHWLKGREDTKSDEFMYSTMEACEKAIRPLSRSELLPWESITREFTLEDREMIGWLQHVDYMMRKYVTTFENPIDANYRLRWDEANKHQLFEPAKWLYRKETYC